jgi:hypothetical protein
MVADKRSNYGLLHGLRKLLLNIKALLPFFIFKLKGKSNKSVDSKLVLIISFPRSGTHALASMINHDEIGLHYYGEFFIFNQWSKIVEHLNRFIPFFSWRYFLNTRRQKKNWVHYRFENTSLDPEETIRKMLLFPGTHTIKIFPEHLKLETLERIIEEFKPHVLFLRRNHLDRYVSLKKANATGKWHKVDSSSVEIEVNEPELARYVENYQTFYRQVLTIARKSNCQILDLEFKDLQDPNKVIEIQKFVSLNNNPGLESLPKHPTTTKMDKASISQDKFLEKVGKKISDFDFVSAS